MKDLRHFFILSRPLNVLISVLAFGLGGFLGLEHSFEFLRDSQFWIGFGVLAVISATGYWVNDAFDFKIDRLNKPRRVIVNAHLSVKKVLTAYFSAVGLTLAASFFLQDLPVFLINVGAAALLFLYAWQLKRTTVIGNLVIAALTAAVLYYAAVIYQLTFPLVWTIVFAFEITFLREVVKDIEDIRGDLRFHLNTLPIRIGIKSTKKVLYVATLMMIGTCYIPFWQELILNDVVNWPYIIASVVLVQLPLLYFLYLLIQASNPKDFHRQSQLLKALIFSGMASILFLH